MWNVLINILINLLLNIWWILIPIIGIILKNKKNKVKLTKTQIEYRKKMNKLIKEGKIVNGYGQRRTDLFKIPGEESKAIKNLVLSLILSIIIIAIVIIKNPIIKQYLKESKENNNIKYQTTNKTANQINTYNYQNNEAKVAAYLTTTSKLIQYTNETTAIFNKYILYQTYSKTEIDMIYNGINEIMTALNEAPEKGDVIKYNNINLAESNKRLLELLSKELDTGTTRAHQYEIKEASEKRNVYIDQTKDLEKGLLGAYEIDYTEAPDGTLHFTYKK